MSHRHKILFQTNAPWLKSGLAENGRILMNWLAKKDKYDLTYLCSHTFTNDPNLSRMPYKAIGTVPQDQNFLNQFANDPGRLRDIYYGGHAIENAVKNEKPTIWVGSDDIWAFQGQYIDSPWSKAINTIFHITIDSIPIGELAYKQAKATKNFFSWTQFAVEEMKSKDPHCGHVDFIYGASDTGKFKPISAAEKADLRKRVGLSPHDKIFIYLGRNQLRKEFATVLMAFAEYKKKNPSTKAKLLFHTAWHETAAGWDLPRLRDYYGLSKDDVLSTKICRNCGHWHVEGYEGNDKDCKHCGASKSVVCVNGWNDGVSDEDLHLVYGLADAAVSCLTSGAQEYHHVNSLLCGMPLACTNYSCGVDFCKNDFVYPISWYPRFEHQSSFLKATNDVNSIIGFFDKICNASPGEIQEISEKGRDWAVKTFSIDAIGEKWEKVFDSLPFPDWSSIDLNPKPKNDKFPFPQIQNSEEWVRALYKNILLTDPDPEGFRHWLDKLQQGVTRDAVYNYFIKVAREDNVKAKGPQDFSTLFDKGDKKKLLVVMKESAGDLFILSACLKGLKELYPDADLYLGCEPRFFEILSGNPYIYRTIPYHPAMESEIAMMKYVDYFYYPAVDTQKHLNYLSQPKIGLELK
jgi:glycosyltransferase involved in cell wall biosynthesis